MTQQLGEAVLVLSTDGKDLNKGLDDAQSRMKVFEKSAKIVGAALTGLGVAGVAIGKSFVDAARVQIQSEKVLAKVVDNTGASWAANRDQIKQVTAALQEKTNFGDEEQMQVLARVVAVTGDVNQAMQTLPVLLDAASVSGQNLGSIANTLTRALTGEVNQARSLGITFDKTATFAERLAIVQAAVGGAAQANVDPFTQLSNTVGDLKEVIGRELIPLITPITDRFISLFQHVQNLNPTFLRTVTIVGAVATALALIAGPALLIVGFLPAIAGGFGILAGALGLSGTAAGGASIGFAALSISMGPILLGVVALAAAIAAGILIWKNWDKIILVLKATFTVVSEKLARIFDSKWAWLLPGGPLIKAIMFVKRNWKAIWEGAVGIYRKVSDALKAAFTSKWGWLLPGGVLIKSLSFLKKTWDTIWGDIVSGFREISEVMGAILGPLKGIFGEISEEMEQLEVAAAQTKVSMEGTGTAMEGTTFKVAALIPPVDQLGTSMRSTADSTRGLSDGILKLAKEVQAVINADKEFRLQMVESRKIMKRTREIWQKQNKAIADQQFRFEHLGQVVIAGADIMANYEQGQISLEQAIFILEFRLKTQQAEFIKTALAVRKADAAIKSNQQEWARWRFEQSDVNQALVKTGATWKEILQAVAKSTRQNMSAVQVALIQAGVGINDLEGLITKFGDSWVKQFVRMRKEAARKLGLDKLSKQIKINEPRRKGERADELGLQGKVNIAIRGLNDNLQHLSNQIGRLAAKPMSQLGSDAQIAERKRSRAAELAQLREILAERRQRARITIPIINQGFLPGTAAFVALLEKALRDMNLAKGSIVTGPTIARIGEAGPEAVIPIDQLMKVISEGRGGGPTFVFQGDVFGFDEFENKVREVGITDERRGRQVTNLVGIS